ncbi:hypothetical protein DFH94DRAFT_160785 [Russula ochroleuca]|uniref:Uncharacterized protein n=1 Tax=Russula ochroleuca TaxID=152965 RepID=A0A9P5N450_9AGAM|nr:hypothetical protein DFH94DRAFT_160785 [Russula ochroleuca]
MWWASTLDRITTLMFMRASTQKDSSPTNSLSGSNTDTASVKIAMLPMTFQNWNTASPRSPLTSQNIDLDHASESRGAPPPAVPGNLPAPTIIQNELGRSHPAYAGTYSQAPQVLTPAAVQAQPSVPGAQGLGPSPMTTVSPHGSKVRQQPMPHEYTRVFNAGGGFANANVGPTAGASPGMKRNEWTGVLYLNGTCAHARARGSDAVGNPNIFAWPMHLQLEPVVNPKFDINAWIGNTRAPHVPLGCLDETDRYHFDHLVGTLSRSGGYAVVRWNIGGQIRERLLLAPAASASGQTLLCAEFPHDGIPMGLTHQVTTNPHHDA